MDRATKKKQFDNLSKNDLFFTQKPGSKPFQVKQMYCRPKTPINNLFLLLIKILSHCTSNVFINFVADILNSELWNLFFFA